MLELQKTINPELKLGVNCVFCTDATSIGDITIGSGTIVHPKAQIIAESGPIIIGENNLIEENACIINRHKPIDGRPPTMIIGNNNVFEIGCKSEAVRIGDNNVLEIAAALGPDVELTNGCIIGTMCHVTAQEIIPANTVIYGGECRRRVNAEKPALQTSQLDHLRKVLPNYHYLVPVEKK